MGEDVGHVEVEGVPQVDVQPVARGLPQEVQGGQEARVLLYGGEAGGPLAQDRPAASPPAADREPTLKIPARIVPGLGLGRNHLKIRPNRLKLVQNNLNSLKSNKGISVNLNEFKVVAATAILIYVNTS